VTGTGTIKDAKGWSSYGEGLSLASYRETSELEYGADDAFILAPDGDEGTEKSSMREQARATGTETYGRFSVALPVALPVALTGDIPEEVL
jgi:replicative DNA helicase